MNNKKLEKKLFKITNKISWIELEINGILTLHTTTHQALIVEKIKIDFIIKQSILVCLPSYTDIALENTCK